MGVGADYLVNNDINNKKEGAFDNWINYQDSNFPSNKIIEMGSIISASNYPGFQAVGKLIIDSQQDPKSLALYTTIFNPPFTIGLSNTVETDKALGLLRSTQDLTSLSETVIETDKGVDYEITLYNPSAIYESILIDNSFYLAPEWAQQLIIVKEASQLMFMQSQCNAIWQQISDGDYGIYACI